MIDKKVLTAIIKGKDKKNLTLKRLIEECKKWSEAQGYLLESKHASCIIISVSQGIEITISKKTEVEAVFVACMWIYYKIEREEKHKKLVGTPEWDEIIKKQKLIQKMSEEMDLKYPNTPIDWEGHMGVQGCRQY